MFIKQETEGMITGRNGCTDLSAVSFEIMQGDYKERIWIDGYGKSGKKLNAGFYMDVRDFDKMVQEYIRQSNQNPTC